MPKQQKQQKGESLFTHETLSRTQQPDPRDRKWLSQQGWVAYFQKKKPRFGSSCDLQRNLLSGSGGFKTTPRHTGFRNLRDRIMMKTLSSKTRAGFPGRHQRSGEDTSRLEELTAPHAAPGTSPPWKREPGVPGTWPHAFPPSADFALCLFIVKKQ